MFEFQIMIFYFTLGNVKCGLDTNFENIVIVLNNVIPRFLTLLQWYEVDFRTFCSLFSTKNLHILFKLTALSSFIKATSANHKYPIQVFLFFYAVFHSKK